MAGLGHQRRLERTPCASASRPIPDISLRRTIIKARYGSHVLRHAAASLFIQHLGWTPKRVQIVMGPFVYQHDVRPLRPSSKKSRGQSRGYEEDRGCDRGGVEHHMRTDNKRRTIWAVAIGVPILIIVLAIIIL
jgi:hypothetical protein